MNSDYTVPLARIIGLFSVLLFLGIGLTVPLFKFDLRKFVSSSLFIKIIVWIPIFLVFLAVLYLSNPVRLAILAAIMAIALFEMLRVIIKRSDKRLFIFYLFFIVGLCHFYFLATTYRGIFINTLVFLCFATVLSDVCAFFMGNYLGKHKLPSSFNSKKSWEGVLGQIVGAFIGVVLVNFFVFRTPSLWLFLPIGIGCVLGDLANSYTKRLAGIKDWGNSIPGHGGYLDRFSSFAGSALLTFYFFVIFIRMTKLAT